MSFQSSSVSIGNNTKKSDYDRLLDNTQYNKVTRDGTVTLAGVKTFSSGTVFNATATFNNPVVHNSSTIFNATSTFNNDILPMLSPSSGTLLIGALGSTIIPRGIFMFAPATNMRFLVYTAAAWRGAGGTIGAVISSGDNVAIANAGAEATVYYLKF